MRLTAGIDDVCRQQQDSCPRHRDDVDDTTTSVNARRQHGRYDISRSLISNSRSSHWRPTDCPPSNQPVNDQCSAQQRGDGGQRCSHSATITGQQPPSHRRGDAAEPPRHRSTSCAKYSTHSKRPAIHFFARKPNI